MDKDLTDEEYKQHEEMEQKIQDLDKKLKKFKQISDKY